MAGRLGDKCAIVVSDELPTGLAVNAASVLAATLGHRVEGLIGADVKDADGVVHAGIIHIPLPILTAPSDRVRTIVQAAAAQDETFLVNFSALAQSCRTYDEYAEKMTATATADLASVGIGLYGPRKQIDKLVGALPLFR
ncbi:DUF2000 domain-containing protein [Actinocatenispora sera]|uniref:DUF2000 domain-containing protein n=1 Tax=Actinocatenispora sera TaxID=390989 RepID=A0A810L093_9ACTN|nr:DUF2000 domain-containing protein [Actinocatenispora sera]BCJ28617.1 hypothetical protein Asera_27250 [Actinocatenispora sera]